MGGSHADGLCMRRWVLWWSQDRPEIRQSRRWGSRGLPCWGQPSWYVKQVQRYDVTVILISFLPFFAAGNAPFPNDDTAGGHLRKVFFRMGFNDREIVALSGAHTLGRAHKNRSGAGAEATKFTSGSVCPRHDGASGYGSCTVWARLIISAPTNYWQANSQGGSSWTEKWLTFDNSYFVNLFSDSADPELLRLGMSSWYYMT